MTFMSIQMGFALSATISAFGAEVYGFLRAVMPRGQDARQTYGRAIEVLRDEMEAVGLETDLRLLFYAVARREARRERERWASVAVCAPNGFALAPEDLEVLVLRLDRELAWREIAVTSLGPVTTEVALANEVARLRERFIAVQREVEGLDER